MPNSQEHFELLLEVSRLLSSKLDFQELLETIIKLSARVVNAETASLLLVDPKTEELYFDVALGLGAESTQLRLKMGQGIAGGCAKDGRSLIINDVRQDPRWSPAIDQSSGFTTRSILAAPMKIKGKVIGVVEAINRVDGNFDEDSLRLFEAFASQAAVAIENARLFFALNEEKARLGTVFSEMTDGAVLADDAGRIVLSNSAAAKSFGVGGSAPETLEQAFAGFSAIKPPLEELLRSSESLVQFEALRPAPKQLIVAGTASTVALERRGVKGSGSGRLLIFRDVTAQRQEEALKRSFLSLISHKLKTPLASITGYSHLILKDFSARVPEMVLKSVQTIASQGGRLATHIDKLLAFTVLEELDSSPMQFEPVDCDELIRQAVDSLQPWLEERQGRVVAEGNSGLTARGDRVLLLDVVKNLIENGIKFSNEGDKKVAVWAETQDGLVAIHVKDRGPGIPPEEQDKIFDKFYQIETHFTGQVEGWGLGLPFVKKVVERHGGSLRLHSKLGAGTTVTVKLPRDGS